MTTADPIRRAFWRTDSTWSSRTAADKRARACRWSPTVIERQLAVRVMPAPGGRFAVEIGANVSSLLRVKG